MPIYPPTNSLKNFPVENLCVCRTCPVTRRGLGSSPLTNLFTDLTASSGLLSILMQYLMNGTEGTIFIINNKINKGLLLECCFYIQPKFLIYTKGKLCWIVHTNHTAKKHSVYLIVKHYVLFSPNKPEASTELNTMSLSSRFWRDTLCKVHKTQFNRTEHRLLDNRGIVLWKRL